MTNIYDTVNESILQANTVHAGTISVAGAMAIRKTERSEWKCLMFGSTDFTFMPLKGDEPNWFWRWTQHLILGHKWIKEEMK